MAEKVLMKGNEAIAEAALIAGCRHYLGYRRRRKSPPTWQSVCRKSAVLFYKQKAKSPLLTWFTVFPAPAKEL